MKRGVVIIIVGVLLLSTGCGSSRNRPREVWISTILAQPQDYWNTEVKIIGIVQDITVNPKGTRQGSYWLMDRNREVIQVKSMDLPNVSDNVVVVGQVGQNPENTRIPLIIETDRQWVWTSFIYIAVATFLLLATVGLIIYRFFRAPTAGQIAFPVNRAGAAAVPPTRDAPPPPSTVERQGKAAPFQNSATIFLDTAAVSSPKKGLGSMTVELEVIAGPDKGKRFHFTRSVITMGRSGKRMNDIELNDITISREQARIELNRSGSGFILRNEGVTNPTLVNGKALAVANLKNGDELLVGTTLMRFRVIE